jgi:hypothetical protein
MSKPDPTLRTIQAGLLGWLIPGAGHWLLGLRGFAWIYFIAISGSYLIGMLVGGVKTSVDPQGNVWLFLAELGVGAYTTVFYLIARALPTFPVYQPSVFWGGEIVSYFPAQDIAQIYLSVAGLMNVIALLDAIARAQTSGLPVFHHEQLAAEAVKSPPPAAPPAAGPGTAS